MMNWIVALLKWIFGGAQSQEAEAKGKAEADRDAALEELKNAEKAQAARDSVSDSPADIVRDPNNAG